MKIHTGTSGFAYKEWKGKFYPEKIPPKEMLSFYAQRLGTVEINNTFYHMPTARVLASWAGQVPHDFVFALKAPQIITHLKRLRKVFEETEYLFKTLAVLERKLGPVLFQIPRSFPLNQAVFEDFLPLIPGDISCAFEFRNPSWLDAKILDLLRARDCSLCIADSDEKPAGELIPTATWGYLRLRRTDYSPDDLSQWRDLIMAQNWEKAFVFFKHEEEAKGAETALRFQELINSK